MSYVNGSGSNTTDLLAAIHSFASGEGWDIVKYTAGSVLFMSNDHCFVSIGLRTFTRTVFTGTTGTNGPVTDGGLVASLGTSLDSSLTVYYGQPGSPEVNRLDAGGNGNLQSAVVNDLAGPFSNWWLFSGGMGDPAYIHVVVQTAPDRFTHFSVGNVAKGALTHAGCGYVTGHDGTWWQNSSNAALSSFNRPQTQTCPFANARGVFYAPDAMPNDSVWSAGMVSAYEGEAGLIVPGFSNTEQCRVISLRNGIADVFSNSGAKLLDWLPWAFPSPYSGYGVFAAIPVIFHNIVANTMLCVGDFPNVRLVNMDTIQPTTEISLGSDIWKVFPVLRQDSWSNTGLVLSPSTSVYGIAYKKIP